MYTKDRHKRVKSSAEIFTSPKFIRRMLNFLDFNWNDINKTKTWIDPTCGTGNFLVELFKLGIPLENIYGVDIMSDNIKTAKNRLFNLAKTNNDKENEKIKQILDNNIKEGNAIDFDYSIWNDFDFIVGNPPYNGAVVKDSTIYGAIIKNVFNYLKINGQIAMIHKFKVVRN